MKYYDFFFLLVGYSFYNSVLCTNLFMSIKGVILLNFPAPPPKFVITTLSVYELLYIIFFNFFTEYAVNSI